MTTKHAHLSYMRIIFRLPKLIIHAQTCISAVYK